MNQILIPVDFSEHADFAAFIGAMIAKKSNSSVHLLHAVDVPFYNETPGDIKEYLLKDDPLIVTGIREKLDALSKKDFFKNLNKVTTGIEYGTVYKKILHVAEEIKADMIVMATHGTNGISEIVLGSNTEKVVRLSDCPVFAVKYKEDVFEIKNIVFASNFYQNVSTVFGKIKEFASIFDAKLHLLKVTTPNQFETTQYSEKLMEDLANEFKLTNFTVNIQNSLDLERGIIQFSNSIGADLIAMTTHGRTGISHLFNGSLTEDLVNHNRKPVLSVKLREERMEKGVIFPG